jgi:tetratricopeptide (TPR) repeat protein
MCSVFTLNPVSTTSLCCAACGDTKPGEFEHDCAEEGVFLSAREECPFCANAISLSPHLVEAAPELDWRRTAPEVRIQGDRPASDRSSSAMTASPPETAAPSLAVRMERVVRKLLVPTIAVVIVIALAVSFGARYTFSKRIAKALSERRFVPPDENSAYDTYMAEAKKNPGSAELATAVGMIVKQLQPEADRHLRNFYNESSMDLSWTRLERYYSFLATLVPNDVSYKARQAYAEGQRHLHEGRDHRAAFESYSRALAYDSTFVLAINGIAKLYMQKNSPFHDEEEAVRHYEQAVAADPAFTWAAKNLGEYYMQHEQWLRAEDYMSRALKTSPSRPSILSALGRIAYRRKKYPEAIDYYTRAIQYSSDPDDVRRYSNSLRQIQEAMR